MIARGCKAVIRLKAAQPDEALLAPVICSTCIRENYEKQFVPQVGLR